MSGDPPIFPGKLRDYKRLNRRKKGRDYHCAKHNTTQHNTKTRTQTGLIAVFSFFFAVLPCVVFLPPAPEGMKESGRRNRNLVKSPLFTPAQQDLSPSPSHVFPSPAVCVDPRGCLLSRFLSAAMATRGRQSVDGCGGGGGGCGGGHE